MNVFIFGCVVFFTMAALVVLIDRFVKQPVAIVEVPYKIGLPADDALATTQTYRTIQPEKSLQKAQTADRIITSLDNDDDMLHRSRIVGGAGVGYASCFAPQYIGLAMLMDDD